jgi:hypothetical protein
MKKYCNSVEYDRHLAFVTELYQKLESDVCVLHFSSVQYDGVAATAER